MILTHESGSQEDQFDEKKWRQKISWDYPFKSTETTKDTALILFEETPDLFKFCNLHVLGADFPINKIG